MIQEVNASMLKSQLPPPFMNRAEESPRQMHKWKEVANVYAEAQRNPFLGGRAEFEQVSVCG